MSVNRQYAAKLDSPMFDERSGFAALAKARRFDLQQHLSGEAIVDLGEIHIAWGDTRHRISARRAKIEPHLEDIGSIRQIVRRIWVARRNAHYIDWLAAQILSTV